MSTVVSRVWLPQGTIAYVAIKNASHRADRAAHIRSSPGEVHIDGISQTSWSSSGVTMCPQSLCELHRLTLVQFFNVCDLTEALYGGVFRNFLEALEGPKALNRNINR